MVDVKLEVTNLLDPFFKTINSTYSVARDLFEYGIDNYLESQTNRIYLTNTFYHRYEKVRLLDVYQSLVAYNSEHNTNFYNLNEAFSNSSYIAITGRAGSGKSMLVKFIALSCIKQKFKIPILIQLRQFNNMNKSIANYVLDKIHNCRIKSTKELLDNDLQKGIFVFIFDGFDEVNRLRKSVIHQQIIEFVERFHKNLFIITSRPGGGVERLSYFVSYKIKPLSKNDILLFIKKSVKNRFLQKKIVSDIMILHNENKTYQLFKNYLSNPLLLSMFLRTISYFPELPSHKQIFYKNIFETLYSHHDAINNDGLNRERVSGLNRIQIEKFLSAFCYVTYFKQLLIFKPFEICPLIRKVLNSLNYSADEENVLYDLNTTIGVFLQEGSYYTFPHRSLQEYFCALFISSLNENKKMTVYREYEKIIDSESLVGDYNFWELCSEIDSVAFNEFFILPILKKIQKELLDIGDINTFIEYFEIMPRKTINKRIEIRCIMKNISDEKVNEIKRKIDLGEIDELEEDIIETDSKEYASIVSTLEKNEEGKFYDPRNEYFIDSIVIHAYEMAINSENIAYKLLKFVSIDPCELVLRDLVKNNLPTTIKINQDIPLG
ncbi:MAG: NACHT domain-containing protein [Bacteroidota bacterium]